MIGGDKTGNNRWYDVQVPLHAWLPPHFDSISAKNGNIAFSRYPLEVLGYYGPTDSFRVGAGIRYELNSQVSSSGAASGNNRSFDDAIGFVVEAEHLISPQVGVKLRAVNEKYKHQGSSTSVSSNHGGVCGSYYSKAFTPDTMYRVPVSFNPFNSS